MIIIALKLNKRIGLWGIGWFPGFAARLMLAPVCKVMVKVIPDYEISKGLKNKKTDSFLRFYILKVKSLIISKPAVILSRAFGSNMSLPKQKPAWQLIDFLI